MNGPFKIGAVRPIQYFFAIGVVIGLLFSMISDGDESVSSIIPQIIQWQLQVLIPLFILIGVHTFMHKSLSFDNLNPWLKLTISGFIGALIFSPLALWIDTIYGEAVANKFGSNLLHEFISVAPPVILSWIAINAPWLMGFQLTRESKPVSKPNTSIESNKIDNNRDEPDFYKLLPENIRGELVYLKSELHYLKVVTSNGSGLILFNLKDAITQINPTKGFKTHRSFWVAKQYIKHFRKTGRQGLLTTIQGDEIPVSRNQISTVQNALNKS